MTKWHDIVIIGAGHNGLVCAAYLAKAGKKVLVLERAERVGGAAITREFAKGFRVSAGAHILHMLQPRIVSDLKLEAFGLDLSHSAMKTISLGGDGKVLTVSGMNVDGVPDRDKKAYADFSARMERHARALAPQLMKTPPRLAPVDVANTLKLAGMGWDIRFGLGKERMRDFMRIVGMNIHDLLDEVFESEPLKSTLAFDAILGTAMEPRMPGTVMSYLYRLAGGLGGKHTLPTGGMGRVTEALAAAAESLGVDIRLEAAVEGIILENGCVAGVRLAGAEDIRAPIVISNADPKTTFLGLVGARNLEAQFAHRIGNFRTKGFAAKVHIALSDLPAFNGLDQDALKNRLIIAPSRTYLEHAFNHSKYGEFSDAPAMEITIPTLSDPTLAPDGKHVLSAIVQYAPYDLRGGWDKQKNKFVKRVLESLSACAPDLNKKAEAIECLAPPDLEREFGMTGGHWHHGDLALDQMFMLRPTYGASQYHTPIDGLYLCGAGAHPGGGVMGAAGFNAARTVLGGGQ